MKSKIENQKKESKEEDSKQEETDEIEEFLVWRPAPAREHSSEGFEPRRVIEVKEEDWCEENVEEDFDVAGNDEDDEENAIEGEIETN